MNLLLLALNHAPEKTGIGKYQGEMAAWLAARGHNVTVITAPPYYPEWKVAAPYSPLRYKTESLDGATLIRVPLYVPAKPTGLKRLLHLASYVLAATPVALYHALRHKPEAVLVTAPPLMAAPLGLLAARLAGVRAYLHVQDFEVDAAFQLGLLKNPRLYRFALALEALCLRAFTGVSTISPNMRAKLLEKGVLPARAHLAANWANTEQFTPESNGTRWRAKLNLPPESVLALYSGNLGRKQGLETIVEAAALLQNRAPNIHFVVCGDGAGRADMQAAAQGLPNITFLPLQPMEDFISMMCAADLHLLPQKAGAADLVMPSKLGNILASGRPVVAGAAEGTQVFEAVQGCGLACPPEEAQAFAAAIEKLAQNAALREEMGQTAARRAHEEWSKESLLKRMESLLAGRL